MLLRLHNPSPYHQSSASSFVVFQEKFGLSYTMLGSLVVHGFVTQLIVDALAIKLVDKIGTRIGGDVPLPPRYDCHGFLPRVFPSPYMGLITASVLFSVGGRRGEVLVSPIVESLPGEAKASAMSLLHSFYSWGQVLVIILSTSALLLVGQDMWYLLPLVWSLLPLYNFFKFRKVPLVPSPEESKRTPLRTLFRSKIFLLALLLMICSGAGEHSMGQWASLFAEKGLGISKALGDILGPCLFAIMMGIARTWYGIKGQKTNIHTALTVCSALCVASFIVTALCLCRYRPFRMCLMRLKRKFNVTGC